MQNIYVFEFDAFYALDFYLTCASLRRQANLEKNPDLGGGSSENEDEEASWSDWNDESAGITCLFCKYLNNEFTSILRHMRETHEFDFEETVKDLTFYQKVENRRILKFANNIESKFFQHY